MFSCCRCVNPKSPKYKKKSAKDNDGDDDSSVIQDAPCHGENHGGGESSEEEIKVEIMETEDRGVESVACSEGGAEITKQPEAVSDETGTGSGTSTSTATVSPAKQIPTENEANQSQQQQPVAVDCPKDSPAKPAAEEPVDEPAPVTENVIPTTVAEVEEANQVTTSAEVADVTTAEESAITANEERKVEEGSESCGLKNEENNVIMEYAVENARNGHPEKEQDDVGSDNGQEPEQEQKVREFEGNGKRMN